jgi:polyhydroxybutyrate depolymerase
VKLRLILFLSSLPLLAHAAPVFPDIADSWEREAIEFLTERGILEGYPDPEGGPEDSLFRPDQPANRAEFVTALLKSKGGARPVRRRCFRDVPRRAWFAPYVCAALRRGIVEGFPDHRFHPERTVNVAEALTMILRLEGRKFPIPPRRPWYAPYLEFASEEGIFQAHRALPWTPITRARMAELLANALRLAEGKGNGHWSSVRSSRGCGRAVPASPPTFISIDGTEQPVIVVVPEHERPDIPHRLIVAFHGRTNSAEEVRSYYGLEEASSDTLLAYPQGLEAGGGTYRWSLPGERGKELWGLRLFNILTRMLAEQYCLDLDKIYTVGHSLGAWMANTAACAEGGIVRASATVGGTMASLPCKGPAAAMLLHNPEDDLVSIRGGEQTRDGRLRENACSTDSIPVEPQEFHCQRYLECSTGNPVLWCPHELHTNANGTYYPHQWPEGVGKEILDFFHGLEEVRS